MPERANDYKKTYKRRTPSGPVTKKPRECLIGWRLASERERERERERTDRQTDIDRERKRPRQRGTYKER